MRVKPPFEYLIVRCHGLATHLIPPMTIKELLHASDLRELVSILMLTDYGEWIRKIASIAPQSLNKVYTEVFKRRVEYVASIANGPIKDFMINYLRRYEVDSITHILRKKLAGAKVDRGELIAFSFSEVDLDRLIAAEDLDKCLRLLSLSRTYGGALTTLIKERYTLMKGYDVLMKGREALMKGREALKEIKKLMEEIETLMKVAENPLLVEALFKKAYYESVLRSLRRLPADDAKILENMVRAEVDVENCFIASAPYLYGHSAELVSHMFIPHTLHIPVESFIKASEAEDRESIIHILRPYREVIEAILNRDEALALTLSRRRLREKLVREKLTRSISPVYAVLYIRMCEDEWRDLRFITYAIDQRMRPSRALRYLICAE